MITIHFKGGHTVTVQGATQVVYDPDPTREDNLRFICQDAQGQEMGRFLVSELLGYIVMPEPGPGAFQSE